MCGNGNQRVWQTYESNDIEFELGQNNFGSFTNLVKLKKWSGDSVCRNYHRYFLAMISIWVVALVWALAMFFPSSSSSLAHCESDKFVWWIQYWEWRWIQTRSRKSFTFWLTKSGVGNRHQQPHASREIMQLFSGPLPKSPTDCCNVLKINYLIYGRMLNDCHRFHNVIKFFKKLSNTFQSLIGTGFRNFIRIHIFM